MTESKERLWVTDPEAYRKRMDNLIGGRDPLDVIAQTPEALARIVSEHPADQLRKRPFPGKWTPNEILGHLTDAEWVYGYRMRQILCEDDPRILNMDQDLWASGQQHNDRDPQEHLTMFRSLRQFNLRLWKRMTPTDFERTGQRKERGPEALGTMLRMLAGHDLSHLDQISRYLEAVMAGKGG